MASSLGDGGDSVWTVPQKKPQEESSCRSRGQVILGSERDMGSRLRSGSSFSRSETETFVNGRGEVQERSRWWAESAVSEGGT
jgi:hypothetical protein